MAAPAGGWLPGYVKVGDDVYYVGISCTLPNGDKLVHGQCGEAVGPADGSFIAVWFPGHSSLVPLELGREVSRNPPAALPGRHKAGDQVYFVGRSAVTAAGERCMYGQLGEVTGPHKKGSGLVAVHFPDNKFSVGCRLDQLSRDPPDALPGDYKAGDHVRYLGARVRLSNGDRLVCGMRGEVTGPGLDEPWDGGVAVMFRGNRGSVACYLEDLCPEPTAAPPGHCWPGFFGCLGPGAHDGGAASPQSAAATAAGEPGLHGAGAGDGPPAELDAGAASPQSSAATAAGEPGLHGAGVGDDLPAELDAGASSPHGAAATAAGEPGLHSAGAGDDLPPELDAGIDTGSPDCVTCTDAKPNGIIMHRDTCHQSTSVACAEMFQRTGQCSPDCQETIDTVCRQHWE